MGRWPVASPEPLSAVVLAAGQGVRLGGVLKPLIRIDEQPIVCRLAQSLMAVGIGRIVVVLGPHTRPVRQTMAQLPAMRGADVSWVEVAPGSDQMHSLRQGLLALAGASCGALVCLADQPLIDAPALHALCETHAQRPPGTDMLVPTVGERPGNPVVLSARLVQEWQGLDESLIGKRWRDAHPQRVHRWHTTCSAYTTDLDTPQDLDALRQAGLAVALPVITP